MCFNPSVALVGPEPHFNCRCKGDELPLKEVNKREAPFNKQLPTRTKEKEQKFLLPNGQTSFAFGKVKIEGWAVFYKGNQSVAILAQWSVAVVGSTVSLTRVKNYFGETGLEKKTKI